MTGIRVARNGFRPGQAADPPAPGLPGGGRRRGAGGHREGSAAAARGPACGHPRSGGPAGRWRRTGRSDRVPGRADPAGDRPARSTGRRSAPIPALVDETTSVGVAVFTGVEDQTRAMRAGTVRLLALGARSAAGFVRYQLTRDQLLTLSTAPQGSFDGVIADATTAAIDALLDWAGGPAWDRGRVRGAGRQSWPRTWTRRCWTSWWPARPRCAARTGRRRRSTRSTGSQLVAQIADMKVELASMVGPGFLDHDHRGRTAGPGPLPAGAGGARRADRAEPGPGPGADGRGARPRHRDR